MPSPAALRERPRTLLVAAAVPLALAAVLDGVRVRRQREAAGRDELTRLPRRTALNAHGEKLLAARRRASDLLVLVCDGDGFKAVNDTYGHAAGDQVVVALGQRLRRWCTTRQGLAARLGGDEFAGIVTLPRQHCARDLQALREVLNQPIAFEGEQLGVTVSIGAAYAADLPGQPWNVVLRAADVAMYRIKRGEADFPYLGTVEDAGVESINGRRPGRPGTHLTSTGR